MNTVEKGNIFEEKAFEIIKKMIEQGSLGIKDNIKIFRKKGYYSNTRKKDIKFDISIEVWPPGAKRFALIYFIECKNYGHSIPVDDIEVFYQQAEGVAEGCFKCVFIANNAFQEGLHNFAETKRIMLVRAEASGNDYEIILHKTNVTGSAIPKIIPDNKSVIEDLGIELLEKIIDKAIKSAFKPIDNGNPLFVAVSFLSKKDIDKIVKKELAIINPNILNNAVGLNVAKLEQYLKDNLEITVDTLSVSSPLLGSCDIKNKVIGIHPSLIGTKRHLFVLAHELGHYVLHKDLKMDQTSYDSFTDLEVNFRTNRYELTNAKHWIEWQANYFASALVLPDIALVAQLLKFQNVNNLSNGALYVDDQIENRRIYNRALERLSYLFDVTKTSIIYRLKDLNMLQDNTRLKSIGQLISEFNTDIF